MMIFRNSSLKNILTIFSLSSIFILFGNNVFPSPNLSREVQEAQDVLEVLSQTSTKENALPSQKEFLSLSEGLVSMEIDGEIFLPYKTETSLEIIHAYKNDVRRYFYDELFRVTKKEKWQIRNAENYEKISFCEYFYKGESHFPFAFTSVENSQKDEFIYNEDGNITSRKKSLSTDSRNLTLLQEDYSYNEKNEIVKLTVLEYFYLKDYSALDYKFQKEYDYFYTNFGRNMNYYENGILKNQVKYSFENEYEEEVFFDGGFSVISYFKDSKKIKEQYFQNSKVIREVLYE